MTTRMLVACLSALMVACGGDLAESNKDASTNVAASSNSSPQIYKICPGPDAQDQLLRAFFFVQEGDTIELCAGEFELTAEMPLHDKRGITLKGAGKDNTILNFANSNQAWGISGTRTRGFTLQGLTVKDAPSVGIMIIHAEQFTLRDVRVMWTGYDTCTPREGAPNSCTENGEVGMVVELSRDILVEDSDFFGGVQFGLGFINPKNLRVRNINTRHNLIGLLLDDARRVYVSDSVIEANTVGIVAANLIEFLPDSAKVVLDGNTIRANNTPNFAATGGINNAFPNGIGILLLAADQYEVMNNEFLDNNSTAIVMLNWGLLDPSEDNTKFDFYPEGINIHDNLFRDNGGDPAKPDPRAGPVAAFIPLILARNGGKSAQIIWDGGTDSPNDCDSIPTDERGVPLNEPNPDSPRDEPRTDERGRPNFTYSDPEPECRWNAWKFDENGELNPENRIYIDGNTFESTKPQTQLVNDFVNFHITATNEQAIADATTPASNDLAPHAGTLASYMTSGPDLPYLVDSRSKQDRIDPKQAEKACAKGDKPGVNWKALLHYNCPTLSDYGLFADTQDPRSNPTERGMLYKINTSLFSDYAVKYRFIFVPPGEQIRYADYEGDPAVAWDNDAQRSMDFPVGSVIAKTFAFRKTDEQGNTTEENVVETRLLIKRQQYDRVFWVGMAYRWEDQNGTRVASLLPEGATTDVSFDYLDEDPEVLDAQGNRRRYTGGTEHYAIPPAATCAACHGGTARDPGTSPISAKPRHLNREEFCTATGGKLNQLECLVAMGLLEPLPDVPAQLERTPRWNVPGDAGEPAGSSQDKHKRMRAYLEVNCSYCHSEDGRAGMTRMFLDSFRSVDRDFGICRPPLLEGRWGGRNFDIEPGNGEGSILHHRDTISGYLQMPPLARSLHNEEASALMIDWIDNALTDPSVEVDDMDAMPFTGERVCQSPL